MSSGKIKSRFDEVGVENTQGLIDKSLLLEETS